MISLRWLLLVRCCSNDIGSGLRLSEKMITRMKPPGPAVAVLWVTAATLILTGAWQSMGAEIAPYPSSVTQTTSQPVNQISVPEGSLDLPLIERLRSILGLAFLVALAWVLSVNRKNVAWRIVIWGISLQVLFAFFILRTDIGADFFDAVSYTHLTLPTTPYV